MDLDPALPRTSHHAVAAGRCRGRTAGVRRARGMHRGRDAVPASTAEAATVSSLPESGELDPGTYLVTGFTVPFEITVPDGWESGGWFVFKDPTPEEAEVAVNFQVPELCADGRMRLARRDRRGRSVA